MQPYQMASEEIRKQGEVPSRIGSFAAGAGVGLAASKVIPFLSSFIPEDIATKALSKVDPRFGSFIKTATDNGVGFDEIKKFIFDKIQKSESGQAKETKNIIEKYSPELFSFLKEQIGKGKSPVEAGALAQLPKSQFSSIIKKMEEDNKANWTSIIESVFGSAQQPAQSPSSAEMMESKMQNFFNRQQQQPQQAPQQQPQQQMGAGQQALMQLLQQINQKLG